MMESPRFRLDRRALLASGAALIVTACSNIIGPPDAPQIYVLQPTGVKAQAGARVRWMLAVEEPAATDSYATNRIAISRSANTLDYYANAAWPDRLTSVVQGAILDAFEDSGRIDQVARSDQGLHATYILQSEVEAFEARYDQPDGAPTAVIKITVKLVDEKARSILASTTFAHEQAASANTVAAAVDAFDAALGDVLNAIVSWAFDAAPPVTALGDHHTE